MATFEGKLLEAKAAVDQGVSTQTARTESSRVTAIQAAVTLHQTLIEILQRDFLLTSAAAATAQATAGAVQAQATETGQKAVCAWVAADAMAQLGGEPWRGQSRGGAAGPSTGQGPMGGAQPAYVGRR